MAAHVCPYIVNLLERIHPASNFFLPQNVVGLSVNRFHLFSCGYTLGKELKLRQENGNTTSHRPKLDDQSERRARRFIICSETTLRPCKNATVPLSPQNILRMTGHPQNATLTQMNPRTHNTSHDLFS